MSERKETDIHEAHLGRPLQAGYQVKLYTAERFTVKERLQENVAQLHSKIIGNDPNHREAFQCQGCQRFFTSSEVDGVYKKACCGRQFLIQRNSPGAIMNDFETLTEDPSFLIAVATYLPVSPHSYRPQSPEVVGYTWGKVRSIGELAEAAATDPQILIPYGSSSRRIEAGLIDAYAELHEELDTDDPKEIRDKRVFYILEAGVSRDHRGSGAFRAMGVAIGRRLLDEPHLYGTTEFAYKAKTRAATERLPHLNVGITEMYGYDILTPSGAERKTIFLGDYRYLAEQIRLETDVNTSVPRLISRAS